MICVDRLDAVEAVDVVLDVVSCLVGDVDPNSKAMVSGESNRVTQTRV